MSTKKKLLEAAAGAAGGGAVYVDDVFSTYLYNGNNGSLTIDNGIDLSGEGGLVWQKGRSFSSGSWSIPHLLFDTERGARKLLSSSSSDAESTPVYGVNSFNSNGFSLNDSYTHSNSSVVDGGYASWTFRKAPGFFDVVTYTGNGSSQHISHNLGTTPGFIVIKSTSHGSTYWSCWHRSIPTTYVLLNHTQAAVSGVSRTVNDSTFQVMNWNDEGANGRTYVAYLFAHDAQDFGTDSDEAIIKCGSYTGNGNDTGPIIDLGFEPQWVMIKDADANTDWFMFDTMRNWNVVNASELKPNTSAAEAAVIGPYRWLKPLSYGFQITDAATGLNTNTNNHIYIAIRRPHKPASKFAATDLFKAASQTNSTPSFNAGFTVDMAFQKDINNTYSSQPILTSRLFQGKYLTTSSTNAETSISSRDYDHNTGYSDGLGNNSTSLSWMFRRVPGFFDAVAYTGNGSAGTTEAHNLGVVPEMMWVKRRSATYDWVIYHKDVGATKALFLNKTDSAETQSQWFNNTAPTSSVFTKGNVLTFNGQTYIAYLFASTPGVSKVGSYTGTGNDLNVDCGFSAGARFVLVKRTDSTGDWYLWDSVRGIVAGNDPYLLLNDTAAQVTNTDYIDPLSSGFTVTSSAPAALNASGGNYIFYAIA